MALYREDATGFLVDLAAPAPGYTAVSAMPATLSGRVTWWRDQDVDELLGQSSDWHPSTQSSGEDPFPVTDPRAGSGQNTVPPEYSTFPTENTTWITITTTSVTRSFPVGSSTFAGMWLQLASTAANGTAWLGTSSTGYNASFTAGKKWILSFYGEPGGAGDVGDSFDVLVKSDTGLQKSATLAIVSGVHRYSVVVDYTGDAGQKCIIGFRFQTSGTTLKIDRVMLEEQVGPFTTPSAFSTSPPKFNGGVVSNNTLPGSSIQDDGVTGSKIASATITGGAGGNIASGTITSDNIQNATITGTDIATGTITSTNIQDATITGSDIAAATITSNNIQNATITGADIAAATITGSNIASATITSTNIQDASITGTDIASATITGDRIGNLTITGGNIANATIDNTKIINLTADKIDSGTITSDIIYLSSSAAAIQSAGFVSGSSGFRIRGDGSAEFQNVVVRGSLNAADLATGYIPSGRYQTDTISAGPVLSGALHRGAGQTTGSVSVPYLTNTTITASSGSYGPLSLPSNAQRTGVILIGMVQALGPATQQGLLLCGWSGPGGIYTNATGGSGNGVCNVGGTNYYVNDVLQGVSIYYDSSPGTGAISYYFRAHQHILSSGGNLSGRVSFSLIEISK